MKDIVVIGAGRIGATVAGLLASTGDYQVTLADRSPKVLGSVDRDERIRVVTADVLKDFLANRFGQVYARPQTGMPHQRLGGAGR
jgi:saccharopine dehydrogenase-like NADP-dependent oxidoreductase